MSYPRLILLSVSGLLVLLLGLWASSLFRLYGIRYAEGGSKPTYVVQMFSGSVHLSCLKEGYATQHFKVFSVVYTRSLVSGDPFDGRPLSRPPSWFGRLSFGPNRPPNLAFDVYMPVWMLMVIAMVVGALAYKRAAVRGVDPADALKQRSGVDTNREELPRGVGDDLSGSGGG